MDADRLAEIKAKWDALPYSQASADFHAVAFELRKAWAAVERLQAENALLRAALHAWVEAGEKRLSGFRGASVPIMEEDRATSARIKAARQVLDQ